MEARKIRADMRMGQSIFDMPLRVTFYARVSTDKYEQQSSLEHQIQYYTEFIKGKHCWAYVEGYIDEGISGTSTKRRDSFNRMIADAKAGRFDFIITKEISRFSRSTLDSIKYTQELLEHNVGVLFQNDNINTFDPDSEFRLVVMAGVAQDEVRKLSERLKFGFRQAIRNGRVLGNDGLWGYDKSNCRLTVNEREAEIVRLIFDFYANKGLGIRRLSQVLYDMGHTSRNGNEFNVLTIRNILTNPKYKGWYCGNKTQSIDYRSKKKDFLDESEWITYPDPNIPAIVSEELWDRANALYRSRSAQMKAHQSAAEFHNRYAYSGKLICEQHGAAFHRRILESGHGSKEVWNCRLYRQRGRAGCNSPQLRTAELDSIMAEIFSKVACNKKTIIDALVAVIKNMTDDRCYERDIDKLDSEIAQIHIKKDRLLELSIEGAIEITEFKHRNDCFNAQIYAIQNRQEILKSEQVKSFASAENLEKIKSAIRRELDFADGINSKLVSTILDHIVVKRYSTKNEIHLGVHLRYGGTHDIIVERGKASSRFICS